MSTDAPIDDLKPSSVNYEILTPVNFLQRTVAVYGNKEAIVYGKQRYTYSQFQERVFRLANGLKNLGIVKGEKVAFICPNTPPMLEAHFAVPLIGASLVSVNIRLAADEISYILNHSEAKVVFVDNEFSHSVTPILDQLEGVQTFVNICDISDEMPLDGLDYERFLNQSSAETVPCAVSDEYEIVTINYTSGTTGRPKGVMYHHRGAYLNALGEMLETGFNGESIFLWTLPLFHCNGWCFPWGVTAMGGTHICLRKVKEDVIFDLVKNEGVTHLCAAPTILISLSAYADANKIKLTKPLLITTAGAPPAPAVIKHMEAIGASILHVYGLTEVYGPHSVCTWQNEWAELDEEEQANKKSRQGVPMVVTGFMDVVDPETMKPVPHDGETVGEIVMRGNNVMLGYYKNPEATKKAFAGGWFHSGDLAVIHQDHYVQIVDRSKDIIISGGENISTVEVENMIYQHPAVLEVAVVPKPDAKWGEVPKAFITLKPGMTTTEEAIIVFCKEKLARFKVPKAVEFGDLPKTATGKIQKFKLREKEWQGHKKRVN